MATTRKASIRTTVAARTKAAALGGGLANALDGEHFKQFLDQMPFAVAVSQLKPAERIIYVNHEFERLTGHGPIDLAGKPWIALAGEASGEDDKRKLGKAVTAEQDYIGTFDIAVEGAKSSVDVWSNIIEDDGGTATFRLIALADAGPRDGAERAALEQAVQDKDLLLNELQHRVKNNLQMITALIRLEARNIPQDASDTRFDRLAGRVEALGLLYRSLSQEDAGDTIDLGTYLSEIAAAVMRAHAVEGIHLELKVDSWPVTINVAMPTGLVVNELLTNALKHAFPAGREGTITLQCLVDKRGCEIIVADDGIGLPVDAVWPKRGKLSAMIVQSLRQNAKAQIDVESHKGKGTRATIMFTRADGEAKA
ncbi:PAS domain S-box protein [Polymorphobacter arshaanensis]|uniref:histidine kinase n=1 Tax=Glacieibacterium arshaanense TaxID=2511025 RepID=A0A4Y9ENZ6_9SPHN|nr:sensor histidine kinase [Polymorphobacter arshaanensis]TFU03491.1 PAS domain S-box protein [Polymorphobacter arshaanensis]